MVGRISSFSRCFVEWKKRGCRDGKCCAEILCHVHEVSAFLVSHTVSLFDYFQLNVGRVEIMGGGG